MIKFGYFKKFVKARGANTIFESLRNLTVSPLANTPTTQTFSSFPDDFLIYIPNISSLKIIILTVPPLLVSTPMAHFFHF